MRRSALPLLALALAGCAANDGALVMADPAYSAEILLSTRDGITSPDGLMWRDGRLFIADEGGSAVRTWSPGGRVRTLAVGRGLSSPEDLASDGTAIFVSDDDTGAVWRIEPDGRKAILVGATQGVRSSEALAIAADGAILVGDQARRRIVRRGPDGRVTILVGPAAGIAKPESFAFDPAGNLYIADNKADILYRLDRDGRLRTLIRDREGFSPESLFQSGGRLFITDSRNGRLHRFDPVEGLGTVASFAGDLANVQGISGDEEGNLYLSVQTDLKAGRGYVLRLKKKPVSRRATGLGRSA